MVKFSDDVETSEDTEPPEQRSIRYDSAWVADERRLLRVLGQHMQGGVSSIVALTVWRVWCGMLARQPKGTTLVVPEARVVAVNHIELVWGSCCLGIDETTDVDEMVVGALTGGVRPATMVTIPSSNGSTT